MQKAKKKVWKEKLKGEKQNQAQQAAAKTFTGKKVSASCTSISFLVDMSGFRGRPLCREKDVFNRVQDYWDSWGCRIYGQASSSELTISFVGLL